MSGAHDKVVKGVIEDVVHTHFDAADAFRDLLTERADTPEVELRDEALLHARSIAETCHEAWMTVTLLAKSLPEEALPTYVVEVDQSLAESFVLLAADPYHEDLPSEEVVTAWVMHPLLIQWYTVWAATTDHPFFSILEEHGGAAVRRASRQPRPDRRGRGDRRDPRPAARGLPRSLRRLRGGRRRRRAGAGPGHHDRAGPAAGEGQRAVPVRLRRVDP
jgi:hypothetical protein